MYDSASWFLNALGSVVSSVAEMASYPYQPLGNEHPNLRGAANATNTEEILAALSELPAEEVDIGASAPTIKAQMDVIPTTPTDQWVLNTAEKDPSLCSAIDLYCHSATVRGPNGEKLLTFATDNTATDSKKADASTRSRMEHVVSLEDAYKVIKDAANRTTLIEPQVFIRACTANANVWKYVKPYIKMLIQGNQFTSRGCTTLQQEVPALYNPYQNLAAAASYWAPTVGGIAAFLVLLCCAGSCYFNLTHPDEAARNRESADSRRAGEQAQRQDMWSARNVCQAVVRTPTTCLAMTAAAASAACRR